MSIGNFDENRFEDNFNQTTFDRKLEPPFEVPEGEVKAYFDNINAEKKNVLKNIESAMQDLADAGIVKNPQLYSFEGINNWAADLKKRFQKIEKIKLTLEEHLKTSLSPSNDLKPYNEVKLADPEDASYIKLQKQKYLESDEGADLDLEIQDLFLEGIYPPLNDTINSFKIEDQDEELVDAYNNFISIYSNIAEASDVEFLSRAKDKIDTFIEKFPAPTKNVRHLAGSEKTEADFNGIHLDRIKNPEVFNASRKYEFKKLINELVSDFYEMLDQISISFERDLEILNSNGVNISEADLVNFNKKNMLWEIAYSVIELDNFLSILEKLETVKENYANYNFNKNSMIPTVLTEVANRLGLPDLDKQYPQRSKHRKRLEALKNPKSNEEKLKALKEEKTPERIDEVEEFSPAKIYTKAIKLINLAGGSIEDLTTEAQSFEEVTESGFEKNIRVKSNNLEKKLQIKVFKNLDEDPLTEEEREGLKGVSDFGRDTKNQTTSLDFEMQSFEGESPNRSEKDKAISPFIKMRVIVGQDKTNNTEPFAFIFSFSEDQVQIDIGSLYTHYYDDASKLNLGLQKIDQILDYFFKIIRAKQEKQKQLGNKEYQRG